VCLIPVQERNIDAIEQIANEGWLVDCCTTKCACGEASEIATLEELLEEAELIRR